MTKNPRRRVIATLFEPHSTRPDRTDLAVGIDRVWCRRDLLECGHLYNCGVSLGTAKHRACSACGSLPRSSVEEKPGG